MIYYDEHDAISKIVESLAALHLFARDKGFDKRQGGTIYDPDGRAIEFCGPHPYRP